MSAKQRLNQRLELANTLRLDGEYAQAHDILDALSNDPENDVLGHRTSLGLPRRLQSAYLKLSKAAKDAVARAGYQYHLVPPPDTLNRLTRFSSDERRDITAANRRPVPRALHQIWIGDAPLPAGTKRWRRHADQYGYEYTLWREADLEELGVAGNRVYQDMLSRGDYPGAVDVARYLVLQKLGGIYLDCDWYPARDDLSFHDLMPLLGLSVLAEDIPRNTGKGGLLLANSLLATPADHPVFNRLVGTLGVVMDTLPKAPAWWITGPLIFTLMGRGGSITLADADIVAGALSQETAQSDVDAWCRKNQEEDGGLLLAWKSWVW